MATVSSFEGLPYPSKSELRQFAELFMPLFSASTAEAKREAIAALSQNPNVPSAVAFFIASQPISLSAPFLVSSKALDDETLIAIARTQGAAHARTIVRREDLSPTVVDALVGLRHSRHATGSTHDNLQTSTSPAALTESEARAEREEKLRRQLRTMARQMHRPAGDTLGVRRLTEVQEALLVRFARERDASRFAATLSDSLSASHWLSERILLDISGRQLATTLVGIGMDTDDAIFILECFYPHMRQLVGDISRAESMLESLETAECEERIESWRRADRYTTSSGSDADERREEPTQAHSLLYAVKVHRWVR